MGSHHNEILKEIQHSSHIKKLLCREAETIEKISQVIVNAIKSGNAIFIMGNGGSAADAQHIAAELVGQYEHNVKRPGLPVMALTTNSSILTAISNDISFEKIFYRQIEAFTKKNDVVIGISTSGKSKNVINAIKLSKSKGAVTIVFTGKGKNPLSKITDLVLQVPSTNTQRIQECHILVGHIICGIVEKSLTKYWSVNKKA